MPTTRIKQPGTKHPADFCSAMLFFLPVWALVSTTCFWILMPSSTDDLQN